MTEQEQAEYEALMKNLENAFTEQEKSKARAALKRWKQFNGFE